MDNANPTALPACMPLPFGLACLTAVSVSGMCSSSSLELSMYTLMYQGFVLAQALTSSGEKLDTTKPLLRGFQGYSSSPERPRNHVMVRTERLELSHLAAPEPKSGVSTNFTTSAVFQTKTPGSAWRFGIWGGRWGSNPRPQEPQSCALPTELRPPYCIACARDQMNGAPGRIRTCDHPLRRRMLYPTELRAL